MKHPDATREHIEQNESIDVLVRVESLQKVDGDDFDLKATLADRTGKQFGLTVFAGDGQNYTFSEGGWYVLRNASGNIYNGTPELRSNFGKMTVEQVPPPSPEDAPIRRTEADRREAQAGGIAALDIETLTTVPESELDLGNSDHVELLCVGLGYQPDPDAPAETTVSFREDRSPESELALIESVCEWIERRDPSVLLTYKGADFDVEHLRNRPELTGAEMDANPFESLLETVEYHDIDRGGKLAHVADVDPTYWDVYEHSLNPAEWRVEQGKSGSAVAAFELDGGDVPYFGERYLELRERGETGSVEYRALREMLRRYAAGDVRPLFDLFESER